jgi:ERCC4-related helicase
LFEGVARQERRIAEKFLELRPDEDTTPEQRKKILSLQANAQSFLNVFPSVRTPALRMLNYVTRTHAVKIARSTQVQQLFRDDAARVALLTPSSSVLRTDKLSKLLALLCSVAKAKGREGLHCILFVERIVTAFALADAINREFKGSPTLSWLTAQAVAGSKGMSHREQQEVVARFSAGAIPLLVATATLDEGVDVAQCNVAIRFDKFSTTRSYVQAEGRARANGAVIYYFENDYEEEERKSQAVTTAARSSSSQPSTTSSSTSSPDTMAAFRHPYHHGMSGVGGQITIHNCMSILVEYAQKAMKLEIRPTENMFQGGSWPTQCSQRRVEHRNALCVAQVTWRRASISQPPEASFVLTWKR